MKKVPHMESYLLGKMAFKLGIYSTLFFCPRLTNLVRGLWNRLCTCVCVSVHASGLKMLKFASSLSFLGRFWFCLFYLIRLGGGFKTSTQNFEIHYANLCKFIQNQQKMLLLLYFLADFNSVCFIWKGWVGASKLLHRILKLIMQIYANLFKINEKCYFSSISWPILILFVLSDRAWWELQNFYTELINYANLLCKFIQNQWKMLLLFYFLAEFNSVCFIW